MARKTKEERELLATLGYRILMVWLSFENDYDKLRKVFMKSALTPQDVVFETRYKRRCLTGDMNQAIYEYIQYALYREMKNNRESKVIDTIYEIAKEYYPTLSGVPDYSRVVRYVTSKNAGVVRYNNFVDEFVYFFLIYERIQVNPLQLKVIQAHVRNIIEIQMFDKDVPKGTILTFFTFENGESIEKSEEYQKLYKKVNFLLIDYLKKRYNTNCIDENNWADFVGNKIHMGLHGKTPNEITVDSLDCLDRAIFQGINTLACEDYHFSYDALTNVMGDMSIGRMKGLNYYPNVSDLYITAFQALVEAFCLEHPGKCTYQKNFFEKLFPFMSKNIEGLYNNLVYLYYIDCIYKVLENNRDEYYYNFPWFYDIEKQDTPETTPVSSLPQKETTNIRDGHAELNAQYERERKRVIEISRRHSHELAEKDRVIDARDGEIATLKQQLQLQQEFMALFNTEEETEIADTVDINSLYGKRFLFVGKVYESYSALKKNFPNSIFMESETANLKSLKVDGVVLLIRNMSHSMYYKVMQSNQFTELPLIYCNSRNINNVYQAMLRGMQEK